MKKRLKHFLGSFIATLLFAALLLALGFIHPPVGLVSFPIAMFTLTGSLACLGKDRAAAGLGINPYEEKQ